MYWQRDIELLTPTFCRGAYQDSPEIRVPSIRGMVRWWFRALGGSADEEKQVFGGLKRFGTQYRNEVMASNLVFRVSNLQVQVANPKPPTLPHKQGGQASYRAAFAGGGKFHLEVFTRFDELPDNLVQKASNALEVWLLLGSLGLRANRGGGSLWPCGDNVPDTPAALRQRLNDLGCQWPVYLADPQAGNTAEKLRAAATDTVRNHPQVFGSAHPRQASPIKFKIVRLEGNLRLLITAQNDAIIQQAKHLLQGHRSKPETWEKLEE
ncbi:type III-B CRISPR module RAMP protein Cmr1 [Fontisphaera persica]|uniref:type III-B CRISPR module RAMP protein Cmr1 n=1 Tax=Fontisphaera persica TaxID=2974023 RepID=UPI0024BFE8A4|nr:type III-B CRISPR module RAMP protein Cmr1 [Fontisphaera persica]WCJ60669.1 type III-B CRISPR module RAMP protein Cmr1 [Fontisphaera persica]